MRTPTEQLLHVLTEYLQQYPEIRFCQALFNLGILEQRLGGDMLPRIIDPHHYTDVDTWNRVKAALWGKYTLKPQPNYGTVMTIAEFTEECKNTWFLNRDGHGFYATASEVSDVAAYPSDIVEGNVDPRLDGRLTHVMWYSK